MNQRTLSYHAHASFELCKNNTIINAHADFIQLLQRRLPDVKGRCYNTLLEMSASQTRAFKKVWSNLNKGKYCSMTCRYLRADGKQIAASVNYTPILSEGGLLVKVKGYLEYVKIR